MSKHTPGPWYAVGGVVEHPDDTVPDICVCDPKLFGMGHLPRSREEIIANARLIAAAPDLLDALQLSLEYWAHREQRYKNRSPVWVQEARAAIAKAKGGHP